MFIDLLSIYSFICSCAYLRFNTLGLSYAHYTSNSISVDRKTTAIIPTRLDGARFKKQV